MPTVFVSKEVTTLETLIANLERQQDTDAACDENGNALDGLRRALTQLKQRDRKRSKE